MTDIGKDGKAEGDSQRPEETRTPNAAEQLLAQGSEPQPVVETPRKRPFLRPIDLLILLSVGLVLAATLVPNFVRARARGQLTACKSNLKNISTALEMYSTDFSGKYPASLDLVVPNYLKTLPICPSGGEKTYRAYFGSTIPHNPQRYQDYYYIECYGENHTTVSVDGNYPAYDGIKGLLERDPSQNL